VNYLYIQCCFAAICPGRRAGAILPALDSVRRPWANRGGEPHLARQLQIHGAFR